MAAPESAPAAPRLTRTSRAVAVPLLLTAALLLFVIGSMAAREVARWFDTPNPAAVKSTVLYTGCDRWGARFYQRDDGTLVGVVGRDPSCTGAKA